MLKKSRRKRASDGIFLWDKKGNVGVGVPDDPGCVRQGERPRADMESAPTVAEMRLFYSSYSSVYFFFK